MSIELHWNKSNPIRSDINQLNYSFIYFVCFRLSVAIVTLQLPPTRVHIDLILKIIWISKTFNESRQNLYFSRGSWRQTSPKNTSLSYSQPNNRLGLSCIKLSSANSFQYYCAYQRSKSVRTVHFCEILRHQHWETSTYDARVRDSRKVKLPHISLVSSK